MELGYGHSKIQLQLPSEIEWQVLKKDVPFSYPEEDQILSKGIADLIHAINRKSLNILIIIPDHTRQCKLPYILPRIIKALKDNFSVELEILVANGSHVLQPDSVIKELVGEHIFNSIPIQQHNCHDASSLTYFGRTSFGTDVWLNKKITEADIIITVNGILYHYFAGFGGGPKMILPGVAGYETIRTNHKRTIDRENGRLHLQCYEGNTSTNPVFLDLAEVTNVVNHVISFQVVLTPDERVVACEVGDVLKAQQNLIPKIKELYSLPIRRKADVVIASAGGFPADVNLIQAHKAVHHAFQAVKKGGIMVMFAACSEGIGSQTILPYLNYSTTNELAQVLLRDFQINGQTALALKEKAEKVRILFMSTLDKSVVEKTGMIPVKNYNEALKIIRENITPQSKGLILPRAGILVPFIPRAS